MSQWAESRHQHFVDGVPKKELARKFGLNVKTVRRALAREELPIRREAAPRPCRLDPWRERIRGWLEEDPRITAKRIRTLLKPEAGAVPERSVRKYVARMRRELFPKPAFVHRTHPPGATMEADFGESWALVGGELRKVKITYRCDVCGTEVRMTTANDEMPDPPRHCQDEMDLVTPVSD